MAYLEEFKTQIKTRNLPKFLQLWEEYCLNDQVDVEELKLLLQNIKNSEFAKTFGKIVETSLPLWMRIEDKNESYDVLKLLIDLETTNSPALAELVLQTLRERYGDQTEFNERLRLVGMRTKDNFQGALSNYELLSHMKKGNFVFHTAGWGTGEIMDISPIRQQISVEFENVAGRKSLTFENCFKSLIPLDERHFLVQRFANPDELEAEARKDPSGIVKMLLQDLGPKKASEIKDELCELVIPEEEWTKWWQNARAKLKKDSMVEAPESLQEPFRLRKKEITHEERLNKAIKNKTSVDEIIQTTYSFVRDIPDLKKHQDIKKTLLEGLTAQLSSSDISRGQEIQIYLCLEEHFDYKPEKISAKQLIQDLENVEEVIEAIEIIALKKKALNLIKEHRKDWASIFLNLLTTISHSALKDFIFKELNKTATRKELDELHKKILNHPEKSPEYFLWFFQKVVEDGKELPFSDNEGKCHLFESFFVLLHRLEGQSEYKDIVRKMYNSFAGQRYALVRKIFEISTKEQIKEFLLLASKCQTFGDHDRSILRSLAAVVYPELNEQQTRSKFLDTNVIWTTDEALAKMQDKVRQIGTSEIVENAREIEAARALGDLRENSEYKFAREKRARLLGQLKTLSDQIQRARIITAEDIVDNEVGVGTIVVVQDSKGNKTEYTILGPWEADADSNIVSFQSKFAQAMLGCKKSDAFTFRDEEFTVLDIRSFLTQQKKR